MSTRYFLREASGKRCLVCDATFSDWGFCCSSNCIGIMNDARAQSIAAVFKAVRKGLLPRITETTRCVDCGGRAKEYEHRDYGKPLDVQPVCRSCNHKRGPARVTVELRT